MLELEEEKYVRELFAARYSALIRKVAESNEKTFDHELLQDGVRVAALEVKRMVHVPASVENGWSKDPNSIFLTRGDNAAARVGSDIHTACKQLRTSTQPKILVFVNDDRSVDFLDFEDAFYGRTTYANDVLQYASTDSMKVAQGRIAEEKWTVDLFVWINRYAGSEVLWRASEEQHHQTLGPFFRFTSDAGYEIARTFFAAPEVSRTTEVEAPVATLGGALRRAVGLPNF